MKIRKAINFDLDTNNLKKYYKNGSYTNAYDDIKRFLIFKGFEHRQGSGYVSCEYISNADCMLHISNLNKRFEWFKNCVNKCDVTSVGKEYDALEHLGIAYEIENNEEMEYSDNNYDYGIDI